MKIPGLTVIRSQTLALVALAALAACKSDGEPVRSLVSLEITAAADLTELRQVKIVIARGSTQFIDRTIDWPGGGMALQVGYHLPEEADGTVTVTAEGLSASGASIAQSEQSVEVTVKGGTTSATVTLHLVRRSPGTDGGPPADGAADATLPTLDGGGPDGDVTPDAAVPDGAATPDAEAPDALAPDAIVQPPTPDAAPDTAPADVPVRSWHAGENLQKDDLRGGTYVPDVAIDSAGNVLAIWSGDGVVTVRRFDGQAQTWGALQTIEMQGDPSGARIGLGANGQVLAVWYQYDPDGTGVLRGLWESHSSDGGKSWTKSLRVQMDWIFSVEMAMAPTGEARVAWEVYTKDPDLNYPAITLWSGTYQAATGLFANLAAVKPAGKDTSDREPRIAMDRAGNGILSWQQLDEAGQESVWATGFSGAQALKPQLLEANTTERLFTHNVAMAPEGGKGLVVWAESEGANEWLVFNEYESGVWAGPHREFSSGGFGGPGAAIDRAGVVTVAWSQYTGAGWNVAAARRTPGAGWAPGAALESTALAKADTSEWAEPNLAVDGANNVHVAWRRKTSSTKISFDVVVRRFSKGAWEPETILGHKETLRTYHPRLVVAEDGRAAAAFYFFTLFRDPSTTEAEGTRAFVGLYR
jgi:hypothetical protein